LLQSNWQGVGQQVHAAITSHLRGYLITCQVIASITCLSDTGRVPIIFPTARCRNRLPLNDFFQLRGLTMQRALLIITLILFGILTGLALAHHGYWGIVAPHFQSFGAGQVLADLCIALTMVLVWMWHDARAKGRNIWPWIVATLFLGSFGPLLYLLTAKRQPG
jgi:hypothetical protein